MRTSLTKFIHSAGFYKGREILHPRIGTKENRGREVANAVCISYTTVTFHRFYSVFHSSLLALTLNNFLCDDLFCFRSENRGREVANAVCISYTTVTFHRFYSVFHSSLLALTLNNFLCDDLFCF